jgi:hypothetical protein
MRPGQEEERRHPRRGRSGGRVPLPSALLRLFLRASAGGPQDSARARRAEYRAASISQGKVESNCQTSNVRLPPGVHEAGDPIDLVWPCRTGPDLPARASRGLEGRPRGAPFVFSSRARSPGASSNGQAVQGALDDRREEELDDSSGPVLVEALSTPTSTTAATLRLQEKCLRPA